ncbi:hypothetical protein IKD67_02850 [Candidatus Saccharibacteria bacterium]|nr:hypothetical protein [Candidatus Saccharibacteria bacterium]
MGSPKWRHPLMFVASLFLLASPFFFSNLDTHAADSITVSISGNPSITVAPSSTGTFADSGNINISVSNAPASGYTLAITGGGNTSLTGTTDSTKSITSISSAIDQNTFNINTSYNNKWGYKPSMHYNTSTEQRASNTNYLPSPTDTADIIDITSDSSSNNYTLSIGARVTSDLGFQTYENNTFVITAVGNSHVLDCDPTKLCVEYEGNGLTYDGETLNRVNYNSTTTHISTTKYSHTPNISDDGIVNGKYDDYSTGKDLTDVITIDGASSLHVKITYATESTSYDWAVIWAGNYPNNSAKNNYSSGITCDGAGPKLGGTTQTTKECDISGDTVTFGFYNDTYIASSGTYGYYAVITANPAITRSVASGEYATPTDEGAIFHGWSTTQTTPGSGLPSQVEYTDESDVMANIPGNEGETKTLYAVWQQEQTITFTMDSNTSSIDIIDSNGTTVKTITASGQTATLLQGDTYTIKPTHASGYNTNTITKTSGAGTLNGKEFTVGAGAATIGVTSKQFCAGSTIMQNLTSSTIASLLPNVGSTATVCDIRDGEEYKISKLADNKYWMLDNLRLDPANSTTLNSITASNTHASATTLNYFKNGGGTTSDQYPTAKINNVAWTSSSQNYYSIPMTVSSGTGWTKDTVTTSYGAGSGKIGVYYNYCAASAGSYCYGNGTSPGSPSGNATEDLCPSGWRMPGGGKTINLTANPPTGEFQNLYNYYNTTETATDTNSLQYNLSMPLSGNFTSGSAYNQGGYGNWWSSTWYDRTRMYRLRASASFINPADYYDLNLGYSLRCIAQ